MSVSVASPHFDYPFPPMYYDTPDDRMVAGFDASSDDSLTASITAGAPYFKVSKIDVCNWAVVRPPVLQPGEAPPHVGPVHPPPVPPGRPTLSTPVATSDGVTPLAVKRGQYVRLWVTAQVAKGALPPGTFAGTAVVKGTTLTATVSLAGTYLGTLLGNVAVEPASVAPGQPVHVQVLDGRGQPLSDPTVTVTIRGVHATARYYQFAAPGTYTLIVNAAHGALRESTSASVQVAGTALSYRLAGAPVTTAMPMIQVRPTLGKPYLATFTLGTPSSIRRLLAPSAIETTAAPHAPAVTSAAPPPAAAPVPAGQPAPAPLDALHDALAKAVDGLPPDRIVRIAPTSATTSTGVATNSALFARVMVPVAPAAASYRWDFGDGSSPVTTAAPVATHDYFPAIQAGKIAHSFDVTCTAVHDNLTVKRTLVLHSAYGLCRQLGIIVPPVTGDVYATFQRVAFSGSLVVHNLEPFPLTLTEMASVAVSHDANAAPQPVRFTAMQTPVVVPANSAIALGVYVPLSQLQAAGFGPNVTGFTVYYSGEMQQGSETVPVRFSYTFRIALTDSGVARIAIDPGWAAEHWNLASALRAVSAIAQDPQRGISQPGQQTLDPATRTVAITLSSRTPDAAMLAQARTAIQAGLTDIATGTGAVNAPRAASVIRRPLPATGGSPAPAGARLLDLTFDPSQAPPVAEGQPCYPDDISDADAATAAAAQLVCQLTGQTETIVMPATFQNAQQGDVILSPAPVGGGDMIAAMFRALTPQQHHGHSGIMTLNYLEITHCTASPERITANLNTDSLGIPTSLNADMLKYAWPGSLTQSVDDATGTITLKDPGGAGYPFSSFNPDMIGDGMELIYPLVVKPLPENEANFRPTLRKIADTARSKGARYDAGGNLVSAGACYYSFYCYTKPEISAGFTDPAGPEAGWAQGKSPAVCSSFVWLSAKENNVALVTSDQYEKLNDFSQSAIAGGVQVGPSTRDGLVYYPPAERLQGAQALYQMFMNQALSHEGGLGTLPGVNQAIAGPLADQLLNCFAFGDSTMVGSSAWQKPGDGNAVSPDNIIWWNPPYYGYAEPLQYLPRHTEQYATSVWKKVVTRGTIKGVVRANGAPVPNAHVWVYQPGGDTQSGPDGSYELRNVPIGSYTLSATAVVTTNGVSVEYANGQPSHPGQPVTLSAGNPTLTADIELYGLPQNYRRLDFSYSISCDHGDANPFNAHGVQTAGPYSGSLFVNPGNVQDQFPYTYDYNGGGYFHIVYNFEIALVEDLSIEMSIVGTMYSSGGDQQDQYTFGPVNIGVGQTYSGWMSMEHSNGYHNGPARLSFSATNAQQTG